jgi:hypothetical protein
VGEDGWMQEFLSYDWRVLLSRSCRAFFFFSLFHTRGAGVYLCTDDDGTRRAGPRNARGPRTDRRTLIRAGAAARVGVSQASSFRTLPQLVNEKVGEGGVRVVRFSGCTSAAAHTTHPGVYISGAGSLCDTPGLTEARAWMGGGPGGWWGA